MLIRFGGFWLRCFSDSSDLFFFEGKIRLILVGFFEDFRWDPCGFGLFWEFRFVSSELSRAWRTLPLLLAEATRGEEMVLRFWWFRREMLGFDKRRVLAGFHLPGVLVD